MISNRRVFFLCGLVLFLLGTGIVFVVAVSRSLSILRDQATIRDQIVDQFDDRIKRHPDLDILDYGVYLASYRDMSASRQLAKLGSLVDTYTNLDRLITESVLGRQESDGPWKTFTPNGFRMFYDSHIHPGTTPLFSPPHITGDNAADQRIVSIAQGRGYRLRSVAERAFLEEYEGHLLQKDLIPAWTALGQRAQESGIRLGIVSGFRSVERQRVIFTAQLRTLAQRSIGREYTAEEISAGSADRLIDSILKESSIPGYSKHHTGYALDIVDITSGLAFTEFADSEGHRWMSADNYLNAKRHGFVPSYPDGAMNQGPEPEAWEYVWVGTEVLKETALDAKLAVCR